MGTSHVPSHVLGAGAMGVSNTGPCPEGAHCWQGRETQHISYDNKSEQTLEAPRHAGFREELASECVHCQEKVKRGVGQEEQGVVSMFRAVRK